MYKLLVAVRPEADPLGQMLWSLAAATAFIMACDTYKDIRSLIPSMSFRKLCLSINPCSPLTFLDKMSP